MDGNLPASNGRDRLTALLRVVAAASMVGLASVPALLFGWVDYCDSSTVGVLVLVALVSPVLLVVAGMWLTVRIDRGLEPIMWLVVASVSLIVALPLSFLTVFVGLGMATASC